MSLAAGKLPDQATALPLEYRQASKEDKLNSIAGCIDSDGSLMKKGRTRYYIFSQSTPEHRAMVFHLAELVNSIAGTNAGKVIESEEDGMVIYTVRSTRGIEKISPYLLCEWKRIDAMQSHKDRDI